MSETKNEKPTVQGFKTDKSSWEDFPTVHRTTFMTTIALDAKLKQLVKTVFPDIAGFRPNWNLTTGVPNGILTLSAFFEQTDFDPDTITAFSRNKVGPNGSEPGIKRYTRLTNVINQGSFYTLTEDAKGVFKKYMSAEAKNRDGSIRWDDLGVVNQMSDPVGTYGMIKTYNVINFIDPALMLKDLWGDQADVFSNSNVEGEYNVVSHNVAYDITVLGEMNTAQNAGMIPDPASIYRTTQTGIINRPLALEISQVDEEGVKMASTGMGLNYQNGLFIDE